MPFLRLVALPLGVIAILLGVLFMAQGSNIFAYPGSSFMIAESGWIWRGAVVVAVGAALVFAVRRMPR